MKNYFHKNHLMIIAIVLLGYIAFQELKQTNSMRSMGDYPTQVSLSRDSSTIQVEVVNKDPLKIEGKVEGVVRIDQAQGKIFESPVPVTVK